MKNKAEPIEAVMWRTLKILQPCSRDSLLAHINMTHPCTRVRLSRYLNRLAADGLLRQTPDRRCMMSAAAPAAAPIYRKQAR